MSALIQLSIKGKDGKYANYTISVSDEVNKFGQNVAMYHEQTKEERDAKAPKKYIGNGKVFWTDGKIFKAEKVEEAKSTNNDEEDDGLPF